MQRIDLNRAIGKQRADHLRTYMHLEAMRVQAHMFDDEPVILQQISQPFGKYRSKGRQLYKYRNGRGGA